MKRAIQKTADLGFGSPNTVVVRAPAWVGAGLFGITAPLHLFLELNASVAVAAVTLALIGGAYIGFGAADGRARVFWSELGAAILFGAYSFMMCLLWAIMGAVDVAFTEASVGAGVSTVLFVATVFRTSRRTRD